MEAPQMVMLPMGLEGEYEHQPRNESTPVIRVKVSFIICNLHLDYGLRTSMQIGLNSQQTRSMVLHTPSGFDLYL